MYISSQLNCSNLMLSCEVINQRVLGLGIYVHVHVHPQGLTQSHPQSYLSLLAGRALAQREGGYGDT